jgi:hypothetical protein
MSTLTHTAASDTGHGRPGGRIISGPLALVLLSTFAALASFYLLLSATPADAGQPVGLLDGLRDAGQRRPALIFAASTVAAGVVVSFLPLATGASGSVAAIALLAQALTATLSHWWAGRYGDRHGHARLLVPGLAIASLGMAA